jgi:hypothetical protein
VVSDDRNDGVVTDQTHDRVIHMGEWQLDRKRGGSALDGLDGELLAGRLRSRSR